MANPHKFYLAHMNAKTGYRATWDPGRPLKIGFIGKLDKFGVFTVFSSLDKEGLIPDVLIDESVAEMDYTSESDVSIGTKLAGKAPAIGSVLTDAEAGFVIDFKSEKGIVFKANGYKTHQITSLGAIEKFILPKYNEGNWEKDWLIVTQLVEVSSATIIISNSSNGKLELKASAGVGAANLKLTDASLGLSVAREQGSTLKFIAQGGLTPLYRLMGIRHPLFGKPGLRTKGFNEGIDKEEFQLQEFDPGELED